MGSIEREQLTCTINYLRVYYLKKLYKSLRRCNIYATLCYLLVLRQDSSSDQLCPCCRVPLFLSNVDVLRQHGLELVAGERLLLHEHVHHLVNGRAVPPDVLRKRLAELEETNARLTASEAEMRNRAVKSDEVTTAISSSNVCHV
jgi:hypothetical protein